MGPLGELNDQASNDIEKALDRIANGDVTRKKANVASTATPSAGKPSSNKNGPHRDAAGQAAAKAGQSAADKPPKPTKSAATSTSEGWYVKPHTTKRGVVGKIIRVGPFSAFLPNGDVAKRKALAVAVNTVFRSEEAGRLFAAIDR